MELGGKSPAIVLPSADLKLAANNVCPCPLKPASRLYSSLTRLRPLQILFGGIFNSGQVCMSTERILVHESVASDFEKELVIGAKELEGRDGLELVRPNAVEEIEAHIDEAIQAVSPVLDFSTKSVVLISAGRKAGLPLAPQPHFPRLCPLHFLPPSHLVQYPLPRFPGHHRILRPGALPSDLLQPLSSPFARQRNLLRPVLVHLRLARRGFAPRAAHRGGRGTHQWNDYPRSTRSALRRYQGQRLGEV